MVDTLVEYQVPPQIAKTLTQLTDEPRVEVALRLVFKDALEHRLEKVQEWLKEFRQKYKVKFSTFKNKWQSGKIADRYSYPSEKDYWEWEGLVTRLATLNRLKKWI